MGIVAVQRDGRAPLILSYGLASVELEVPHAASDVFMIGSVSKQFTAAAILLLEQQGLLSTDDPVSAHLPSFRHGDVITIEQLLTHTSGVADVFSLERLGQSAGQVGTFEEVISDLSDADLTHAPGSAYAYSNGGYSVLAAIVEAASGIRFGDFLETWVFQPLNMASTWHDGPGPVRRNRVPGYDPWGRDGLTRGMPIAAPFSTGSGSIWSSAADLLTWTSALYNGRALSDSAYRKLTHDYGNGYGYGVSVFQRFNRDVVGHDGRIGGYATDVARYLEDRVTVVILSNVQSVAKDEIRRLVAAAVFSQPYSIPSQRAYLERPRDSFADFTGVYSFGPGFNVFVREADGRLLARANEGGDSELVPFSEAEWFSRTLYTTVRFGRDETGSVDRLIWGRGSGAPVGRKVPQ
jgi:CubicO group peptidase (beta-lactamase class C family)